MNRPYPEVRWGLAGYNAAVDRVAVHAMRADRTLTKRQVRSIVDAMLVEWWKCIRISKRFTVPQLGTFYLGGSKKRRIRNPQNNKLMMLPARWSLKFRAAGARKGVGHGPV